MTYSLIKFYCDAILVDSETINTFGFHAMAFQDDIDILLETFVNNYLCYRQHHYHNITTP